MRHFVKCHLNLYYSGAFVWQFGLQLPMQSVIITTKFVGSNPTHGEVYLIHHYVINYVIDIQKVDCFLRVLQISSINKTDRHDISEIVLKVMLTQ